MGQACHALAFVCQIWSTSAKLGRFFPCIGQRWPKFGQRRSMLVELRQSGAKFGQTRPTSGPHRPRLAESPPNLGSRNNRSTTVASAATATKPSLRSQHLFTLSEFRRCVNPNANSRFWRPAGGHTWRNIYSDSDDKWFRGHRRHMQELAKNMSKTTHSLFTQTLRHFTLYTSLRRLRPGRAGPKRAQRSKNK